MCGIAGAVAIAPDARPCREIVERMSERIAHRGPDGAGLWISASGRAILAHRRLAIIDLATGDQPQCSVDGRYALVFNGEIYNYRELRADLERAGRRFRTQSDTEVLLQLVERDGDRCVEPLRGMFAFAAWDEQSGRLLLARDRVGKKPLYLAERDGVVYFASSLEAVRCALGGHPALNMAALGDYFSLGWVPSPHTIYEGIEKLAPSTVMSLDATGRVSREFWDLAAEAAPFEGTLDDAVDELLPILREATRIRLRSDVPLGIFLSGGIDSSLVTALAMQEDPSLRTYAIRFDDRESDESAFASAIAEHLGAEHHTIDAPAATTERLPTLIRHFGEPFADSSALPTSALAQYARQHVTVALGGDGGDEGFAGYSWYQTFHRMQRLGRMVPSAAASVAARALSPSGASRVFARQRGRLSRGLRALGGGDEASRYAALRTLFSPDDGAACFAGELRELQLAPGRDPSGMRALYEAADGSALRRMRWVDVRTYLADCLNPKVDVATMGSGLEARAPLLDQEVLRFGFSLPDEHLIDDRGGKRILRAVLARFVPKALFLRPKQGFTPPVHHWLRGALRDRVLALPRSEPLLALGLVEPVGVQRLVDEHLNEQRDHTDRLYALLVAEQWLAQVYQA